VTTPAPAAHADLARTFLASSLPSEVMGQAPRRIVDVYLPSNPAAPPRLRVRRIDDSYRLTWKFPALAGCASVHHEQAVVLQPAEVVALQTASERRVEKDRHLVQIDGRSAAVDVFGGELRGLVLIGFELTSPEELWTFEPPACCGADVTEEDFLTGALLAGRSYEDIEPDLDRLSYVRIDGPRLAAVPPLYELRKGSSRASRAAR
jgi:CYTH domain-containing protein